MSNLAWFGSMVERLMGREDLDRQTVKEMFSQVLRDEQPELHQGAFLAALAAKGETAEEVAGAWEAIRDVDTIPVHLDVSTPVMDNCGTGRDHLKTFNISTAASVVAAAGGVTVARHGARAITSRCGTVDVAEALGVDVEGGVGIAKRSVEGCGLGLFNGTSRAVHPRGLFRILPQIRFGTTLHLAGSLASPVQATLGVRGVFSVDMVEKVALVMAEIGYRQVFVCHGLNHEGEPAMDEASNLGPTAVCRLRENGLLERFTLIPEDVGLKRGRPEELLSSGRPEEEATRLVRLLSGRENGSRLDAICLNASPMFLLAGQVADLHAGIELSRELIHSGKALLQLESWVASQNRNPEAGLGRLDQVMRRAGLSARR
ncbi:MAG: anthranilate phosphoribosyltransferase [Nitrospirota bacterium]